MVVPLQAPYGSGERRKSTIPPNKVTKVRSIAALCRHSSDSSLEEVTYKKKQVKNKIITSGTNGSDNFIITRKQPSYNNNKKQHYNEFESKSNSYRSRSPTQIFQHDKTRTATEIRRKVHDLNSSLKSDCGSPRKSDFLRPHSVYGVARQSATLLSKRKRQTHSARSRGSTYASSEAEQSSPYDINPAWRAFKEQIKLLDLKNDTLETVNINAAAPKLTGIKRGVLDLPGSEQFSSIMKTFTAGFAKRPLLGEEERLVFDDRKKVIKVVKPSSARTKKKSSVNRVGLALAEDTEESDGNEFDPDYIVNKSLRLAAKRGWGMIRRRVKEMAMEKKANKSTFNWNLLRQHVSNITNVQRARMELYDKYIKRPDDWLKNFKNALPESFLNLHQHNIWRRNARRPRTAISVISQKIPENFEEYLNNILEKIRPKSSMY